MKNRIKNFFPSLPLSSLFLIFLTFFAASVASAQIPSTGLVGYWPFNGNANDESGNGNNGTVNGATLTTDRFGNANSAYNFDGNDWIEVNHNANQNVGLGSYTLACWAVKSGTSNFQHLITKNSGTTNQNFLNSYNLRYQSNTFSIIGSSSAISGLNNGGCTSGALSNLNSWNYVVVSFDAATLTYRMYFNGTQVTSCTLSQSLNLINHNGKIYLGVENPYASLGSGPLFLTGKLDDISIYNRALTPAEITQLYTDQTSLVEVPCTPFLGEDQTVCAGTSVTLSASGSSLACSTLPSTLQNGLVGYWPFCGNANDASGNGNNGTVNGATLTADRFGNASSAYSFDGVNDVISVPNSPTFSIFGSNQPSTISFWVKKNNNSDCYFICKGLHTDGCNLGNKYFNVTWVSTNGLLYNLYNSTTMTSVQSGSSYDLLNQWNHVAIVRNAQTKLYINGIDVSSNVSNAGWGVDYNSSLATNLTFGAKNNVSANCANYFYDYFFNGNLDEVSIHSRALSVAEIQQLYTLGQSTYLWSTGATTATINVTPTTTTTYTCTVTDANGNVCTDSVTVFVPQIEATDLTICAGETTTLSVSGITSNNCQALSTNLQTGLVGYWPFCGNANDASGNSNNGTVNGATLTTDRFGNANSAYSFDGVNDFIQCPSTISTLNIATISGWAFCNSLFGGQFVQIGEDNNTNCNGIGVGKGGFNPVVGIGYGFNFWNLFQGNKLISLSSCVNYYDSGHTLTNGIWFHYAMVKQNNLFLYYINGALVGTSTILPAINPTNKIFIGCSGSGGPPIVKTFFSGQLDDVVIHNRDLSAAEIQQLYTLGQTTYLWSTGATTSTINVSPTATTTYTCTVTTNGVSCTDEVTVVVSQPVASITPNGIVEICQGQSIALTANGGVSYLWNTGAPTQSITVNTEAVYTVTVTDANGCTDTESQLVKVNLPPNIGVNNASVCPGQSTTLTATGGLSYVWSPATGLSNTTGTTVAASPSTSTVYTVTGTGANGCTNTAAAAVTVNAAPTATITPATATTFCQGGSVVLNANTGTGLSYQWRLNGNPISGATSSSYTANASGSYTVVVTNTSTCSATSAATVVTVNALPTSTITPASATTFCQGGSVVLNANTGTGLSYQWRLNGTNITGATSSSYTASASGSYTVVVTNTSTCSETSTATVVTVNALPSATITPATATTFCQGGSVVLNANTGAGLSYQWRLNGNPISGATSSSYTANASGSYTVVVTNTSTCSATSTATVVTVNTLPTATITPATTTTFCQGGSVVLNANTGTGLSYQWRLNGTNITGATSSSYTANASGSYTVVVTNTSTCSATSSATVVTVNALPTATVTPATATTFCQGGSVVLNANTGTGLTYQWRLNGTNITGATTASYTANASGSYTVVVTNTSTCSATSTATVVTVNALPTSTITPASATTFCQGGSVVLTANTGTGLSYQWFNNAVAISGATTSSYTANASGSYTVVVTNTSACSTTSTAINVTAVPNVNYYADADGDGFGDAATLVSTCIQPQGYVTNNSDCDDTSADVNPAAAEVCNHIDDDCSGTIDDGLVFDTYYADVDGDTFGDANNSIYECSQPSGYVTNNTDCNDNNANQNTASTEICNGEDDDCDGTIDNGLIFLDYYADLDSDGFGAGAATNSCVDLGAGYVTNNTDCNDNNANQSAASTEICNGEDDDCDGTIDNGITFFDYYADTDGDGFGAGDVISSCSDLGAGYVSNNTDCDDSNSNINSSATETCNNIDDNCDGQIDEGVQTVYFIDNDGDTYGNPSVSILACTQPIGYTPDDTDCNDTDANINPGAEDIGGNGIDENCDGEIDNSIFELNATISLYPNPTRSELNIQVNSSIIGNDLYIFDAVGKLVFKQQLLSTNTSLSVETFANGNYIVRIGEVVKRFEVMK